MAGLLLTSITSGQLISRSGHYIANYLSGLRLPAGVASAALSPKKLSTLPPAVHNEFIHAYSSSLQRVFLAAAPVAAVGFVLSWLLPEVKLRRTVAATDPNQTSGISTDRTRCTSSNRLWAEVVQDEDRMAVYHLIAMQAGLEDLCPLDCCLLSPIETQPGVPLTELAAQIEHRRRASRRQLTTLFAWRSGNRC
jgi:hypothetical protein